MKSNSALSKKNLLHRMEKLAKLSQTE